MPGRNPYFDKVCTVDGCEEPHKAKGYCQKHYDAYRSNCYNLEYKEEIEDEETN